LYLGGKLIPSLQWEIAVGFCQCGNEGRFEYLDRAFSSIHMVVMGLNNLQFAVVLGEKILDVFCCLIIQNV
jgi:hypothetical protein